MTFEQFIAMFKNVAGLYAIHNNELGLAYIGQSIDIGERMMYHLNALKKHLHHNAQLQADFFSFGEDAFSIEMIKEIWDSEARQIAEASIISANYKILYNIRRQNHPTLNDNDISRFHSKVNRLADHACWNFQGKTGHKTGYYWIRISKRMYLVHRIAYLIAFGPFPHALDIDHICHNKQCVNPRHLRVVSHQANCSARAKHGLGNCSFDFMTAKKIRSFWKIYKPSSSELVKWVAETFKIRVSEAVIDNLLANNIHFDPAWKIPIRKLSTDEATVIKMRNDFLHGDKVAVISRRYNVKYHTVDKIVHNQNHYNDEYNQRLSSI